MNEQGGARFARRAGQLARLGAAQAPALLRAGVETLAPDATARGGWARLTFVLFVALPTVVYFAYAALWQSRYYVAETRMVVREARDAPRDRPQSTAGLSLAIQNSFVVLNYIKSKPLLVDLGGVKYLESRYAQPGVDLFSRIERNPSLEDALTYWLKQVSASVDIVSGILTMKVAAFTPQDAARISQDVIAQCERLANEITLRSRRDKLERLDREVTTAADALAKARAAVTVFRQANVLIDPASRAKSIGEQIAKLTTDKLEIENSMATLKGVISPDSPTRRVERARLETIDRQIAELRKSLTSSDDDKAVAAQMGDYERLQLDEQFALLIYSIAKNAYQDARQDLDRQQLYVGVVVAPVPPQEAEGPRIFANTLLLFACLGVAWAIAALLAAVVNDHVA
ncbi:MAG: hypothetical protein U1E19_12725 [Rhodoblastus sp.]